jgi:hypothetical protein
MSLIRPFDRSNALLIILAAAGVRSIFAALALVYLFGSLSLFPSLLSFIARSNTTCSFMSLAYVFMDVVVLVLLLLSCFRWLAAA